MSVIHGGHQHRAEVTRVICASVSRVEGSVMNQLFEMRNRNCERPAGSSLSAALLYSAGWFVLWVEGQKGHVDTILQRTALDPRHQHQKEIHRSHGPATLCEPLTVMATQAVERSTVFARRIYHFRELHKQGGAQVPTAIWQRLSAPCAIRQAPGFGPQQRMALISAQDCGRLELLRKLGERSHSPVIYQRIAGGRLKSSDVGISYLDTPLDGAVRRVQFISRRALGFQLLRESLIGLDGLVLLLGERPSAAAELIGSLACWLQELPRLGALHLVSDDPEVASQAAALLRERIPARALPPMHLLQESQLADFLGGATVAPAPRELPLCEAM